MSSGSDDASIHERVQAELEALLKASTEPEPEEAEPSPPPRSRSLKSIKKQMKAVRLEARKDEVAQKRRLGNFLMWAMGVQLVAANVIFAVYGAFNRWDIEPAVMIAWLSSVVVEVIGVVAIVTNYYFPNRGGRKR